VAKRIVRHAVVKSRPAAGMAIVDRLHAHDDGIGFDEDGHDVAS
jgi:hypothetical protein